MDIEDERGGGVAIGGGMAGLREKNVCQKILKFESFKLVLSHSTKGFLVAEP
jgi:hypothetical protein